MSVRKTKPALSLAGTLIVSALAATAMSAPAQAATYILDFDGATACGANPCGNNAEISQTYGDQANIDLSYRSLVGPGNSASHTFGARWYGPNYGDLSGVMYGGTGNASGVPEVVFTPGAGFSVTLNSADFAGWPLSNRSSSIRVYDLSYNLLFELASVTFPGTGHYTQNFGITSNNGLRLQWGPDGYDGGADNISFSVNAIDPNAVPEPATWAMMLLGFGALGGVLRRERKGARIRFA